MLKKWVLVCLCLSATFGYATERITNFASYMKVNTDGSVQVTEEISVIAEHNKIRRGIVRELPTRYDQPIQILSVSMDGEKHPFFIQKNLGTLHVNFGNDNYIERGPHTYQLQYRMENTVRLFRKHDEIYWNVTGSNWDFPIDQASFELELPNGAQVDQTLISSYVGHSGTKGTPAERNGLTFYASSLTPGNDFTVAVPWQKGLIFPPQKYYLVRYGLPIILLAGLMLLWLYYAWAWNRVGRDPKARVFTQYEPPENFSPARTLYVYSMGHAKHLLLPTVVLSLAMKDALTIHHEKGLIKDGSYMERKLTTFSPLLSSEEAFVLPALFRGKRKVKLNDSSNAKDFLTIYTELKHVLQEQTQPYFTNNTWYNIPTFVYLVIAGFAVAIISSLNPVAIIGLAIVIALLTHACMQRPFSWKKNILPWAFAAIYVLAYADSSSLFALDYASIPGFLILSYFILAIAAVVGGFFMQWIKAYSVFGRSMMDHIEGFKHYLEVGEAGRIAQTNPTDPLQTFCDYLPYAYALGIENKWVKLFEKNFPAEQINSVLVARGFYGINPASFSSSMSSAFSSFSSGVGGGGHAGGGSGGGGGGGR